MNIILCGLPRCGKTTIGKKLALELGFSFVDTDQIIEDLYREAKNISRTCQEIYEEDGEVFFRQLEVEAICSLKAISSTIVSSGGGSVLNKKNCAEFKKLGLMIYLSQNPSLIWERLSSRNRPSILPSQDTEKAFYHLAQERLPLYESLADDVVHLENKKIDEIVCEIKELIQKKAITG